MIRFHALRFDSIRRFHHLFQDEKKAGISNGHFKQMNDYLVGSHVPRPGSHVPGPGSHFSCDPRPGSHVPGPGSQDRTGTGTDSFFRVKYRGTLRSSQKKNLSTAVLAIQKKSTAFQERERNSVPAHPCERPLK